MKNGTYSPLWNRSTAAFRCLIAVDPCSVRPGAPKIRSRNPASGSMISLNCVKISIFSRFSWMCRRAPQPLELTAVLGRKDPAPL